MTDDYYSDSDGNSDEFFILAWILLGFVAVCFLVAAFSTANTWPDYYWAAYNPRSVHHHYHRDDNDKLVEYVREEYIDANGHQITVVRHPRNFEHYYLASSYGELPSTPYDDENYQTIPQRAQLTASDFL